MTRLCDKGDAQGCDASIDDANVPDILKQAFKDHDAQVAAKVLDEVETILDKLYFWYDCEPQPSAQYEEGACSALDHAITKIKSLRQREQPK